MVIVCRRSTWTNSRLPKSFPQAFQRDDDLEGVPEVSEVDVIRHFIRMSTWNYSIDLGMYPLGSCTMKYNSRLNEKVARIPGFANLHPLASEEDRVGSAARLFMSTRNISPKSPDYRVSLSLQTGTPVHTRR